jgi:hypothetical protein
MVESVDRQVSTYAEKKRKPQGPVAVPRMRGIQLSAELRLVADPEQNQRL